MDPSVKEVVMEVGNSYSAAHEPCEEGEDYGQEGGMQKTRRRRRRAPGMSRRGRRAALPDVSGGSSDIAVYKEPTGTTLATPSPVVKAPVSVNPTTPNLPVPTNHTTAAANTTTSNISVAAALGAKPKIVIAPPKKKPAKVMLVPKKIGETVSIRPQKTFKAKHVKVVIDNTAKTQKRRRLTLQEVEAMSEEDLRLEAVRARLSKPETVAKVPVDLLRQMLKDYRMMRGMLL